MSRLTGLLYTLRSLLRRDAADHDLADEIAFHIERQTKKNERLGLSPDDARQRALTEFGGTSRWREEARHARGSTPVDRIQQELRQALRGLRRSPGFTAMAVLTLALALGANAAMFGIVDRVLLRGPEYLTNPDEVVRVYVTRTTANGDVFTSAYQPYVLYQSARDHTPAFSVTATYLSQDVRVGAGIESRLIRATYATPDLFRLIGVHPALGRFYSVDEDRPPVGQAVVVLGFGYWQSAFGGDSSILGKSVTFDDREFRVIGVAPRGFTGVERAPIAAWLPMSARPLNMPVPDWTTTWRPIVPGITVGRLAVARALADEQLTAMLHREYSGRDRAMPTAKVRVLPISYGIDGVEPREFGVTRLLLGVAVIMLLVAAANTTNLGLARAIGRRRELGVRVALGAGRWALVRLMLIESLTIAVIAGALGLLMAHWGGAIVRQALLPDVAWAELPIDGRVFIWSALATLVTGVVVGLIPALRVSRADVASALRGGRTDAGGGSDSHGVARAALQFVQLALSLVLLFTAGLFVRSLRDIRRLDLGYDRERVLAVDISFPRPDTTVQPAAASLTTAGERYERLRAQFARVPGVTSASIAFSSPLSAVNILKIRVPGVDSMVLGKNAFTLVTAASPNYFETVGTRLVRGRAFAPNDVTAAEPVVIVNETMARTIWPGADAIGRCVVLGGSSAQPCSRVVGIVRDVHQMTLKEDPISQSYVPWGHDRMFVSGSVLLIRRAPDAGDLIAPLTKIVRREAPGIQSLDIKSFEELLDPQVRPWRVGATLFGLFGSIVALVTAIGLFSVVSYLVTQRTHEMGVRIALGAGPGRVLRLVLGGALRTAVVGAIAGVLLSIAIAPLVQPLLFDNNPRDPVLLTAVALGLLSIAVVASLWPAWRATRVDPLLALRAD
jgi:predicted permease